MRCTILTKQNVVKKKHTVAFDYNNHRFNYTCLPNARELRNIKNRNMKIVVTGSLGHIGGPLTEALVQNGHTVIVISSKPDKQHQVAALGATAAIGSVHDVAFLTAAFAGADAVYCMVPPDFSQADQVAYYMAIGSNYVQAIRQSGVSHVVNLSSYGAHLAEGTGLIVGAHRAEQLLNKLPGVAVTHLRPGYFYYNLYSFVTMIKGAGFIGANYGGEDKLVLVAPADIAAVAAEELQRPAAESKVRYIVSDDRSCNEIAQVIGKAIGKPGLQWLQLTNEQMEEGLLKNGVPAHMAANLTALGAAIHSGALREDYDKQTPGTATVKMETFAEAFAAAFNQ